MPPVAKPLASRYVVDSVSGCWEWTGTKNKDGYGQLSVKENGRVTTKKAHRLVYEREVGPIPLGLMLDHKCRNRGCVNPSHLEIVTNAENVRRGNSAKLSLEEVKTIREQYAQGQASQAQLANRFQVDESLVQQIVTGKCWTADVEHATLSIKNRPGRKPRLTREHKQEIVAQHERGALQRELALKYGVSISLVSLILKQERRV